MESTVHRVVVLVAQKLVSTEQLKKLWNYAFKGSSHPDNWSAIEHQYEAAKASLISLIERNLK